MGAIYRKLKDRGFEALSVTLDSPTPNIPEFVRQYAAPFPIGSADPLKTRDFFQYSPMERATVPWLMIIDRQGIVQRQFGGADPLFNGGEEALMRVIEPLLGTKAPAKSAPKAATKKK